MADFTLEERKHIAQHLMDPSYPEKEAAQMSVDLLLQLGYKAELVEAKELTDEGFTFGDGPEWRASCKELEVQVG